VRLLLHDTLATAPFTHPMTVGWVEPAGEVAVVPHLRAVDVNADDVALVPTAEAALLRETHRIVPDVAVVSGAEGAIVMRVPVRPDEIERTPVRLWEVSGTAELLARATLRPFYGIVPTVWTAEESAEAQVVVVEGVEALRTPEGGFAENLCRAWVILTGEPVVTHVLVAPVAFARADVAPVLATLTALREAGHARRRELRAQLAQTHDLAPDRLLALFADQRLSLERSDRRALLMLVQRGGRGSAYPAVAEFGYLEPGAGTG
jgi:predicted solute-binding protein